MLDVSRRAGGSRPGSISASSEGPSDVERLLPSPSNRDKGLNIGAQFLWEVRFVCLVYDVCMFVYGYVFFYSLGKDRKIVTK